MPSDTAPRGPVLVLEDPRDRLAPPHALDLDGLTVRLSGPPSAVLLVGRLDAEALALLDAADTDGRSLRLAADRHLRLGGSAAVCAAALAGRPVSVHDVSDALGGITVAGPLATELLAAGTAADLSPAAFARNGAVQTELGRVRATIVPRADGFDLLVDAPSLAFVWTFATTTARLVAAVAAARREGTV